MTDRTVCHQVRNAAGAKKLVDRRGRRSDHHRLLEPVVDLSRDHNGGHAIISAKGGTHLIGKGTSNPGPKRGGPGGHGGNGGVSGKSVRDGNRERGLLRGKQPSPESPPRPPRPSVTSVPRFAVWQIVSQQESLADVFKQRDTRFPLACNLTCADAGAQTFAQCRRSVQDVDRRLRVLVLVGRLAPGEVVGARASEGLDQRDAGLDRTETCGDRSRGSGSRRTARWHACGTSARTAPDGSGRPAGRARSALRRHARARTHGAPTSSNGFVVPRPSERFVPSNSTVPG